MASSPTGSIKVGSSSRHTCAIGTRAENICSSRAFLILTQGRHLGVCVLYCRPGFPELRPAIRWRPWTATARNREIPRRIVQCLIGHAVDAVASVDRRRHAGLEQQIRVGRTDDNIISCSVLIDLAKPTFDQRRLEHRPEGFEWNHRRDRQKWMVLFVETFEASVQIEEIISSYEFVVAYSNRNLSLYWLNWSTTYAVPIKRSRGQILRAGGCLWR